MNLSEFESKLNTWGQGRVPFLFLVDFEMEDLLAWKLNEVPKEILFSINGFTNASSPSEKSGGVELQKYPTPFPDYKSKFDFVKERIVFGDSYLANLTIRTKIELHRKLDDLFFQVHAKYKVCWKNKFLVFSPETFVKIQGQ